MSNQEMASPSVDVSKEIEAYNVEAQGLIEQALGFIVDDQDSYEAARTMRGAISEGVNERKAFVKPRKDRARAAWQDWVDLEKQLCADPEKAMSILGGKMSAWANAERAKARAREEELKKQAADKGMDADLVSVEAPKVKGQRKVYRYKVVDFSKLPDEYKAVDEKKLGALARSSQGSATVPGVEFTTETVTTG